MLEISVGKKLEISAGPKTELETSSLNIRLAKEDTAIADLETKLSQLKTSVKEAKLVVYEQGTNVVKKTSGLSIQLG